MTLTRFDPPAFLDDFTTESQRELWSDTVSGFFDTGVRFNESVEGVRSQFYNPTRTETGEAFDEAVIDWPGFPKLVRDRFPNDPLPAWREVDTNPDARLDLMDEYLEWHVVKNQQNKITRVSFTCETTQYYKFLADNAPQKLLAIYKDLVDPAFKNEVRPEDLVRDGEYQPENRWNTEHGAVHLIQPANNLEAEVLIAAEACILRRRPNGTPITDSNELIECARFGTPGRASDPKIGSDVNVNARAGSAISLRNPVALYMTGWHSDGLRKPNGTAVGNYWRLVRGRPSPGQNSPAMGLHLVYEVPASEDFVVGDIRNGNRTIEFGGELAERISVGLYALVSREGEFNNPLFRCGQLPREVSPLASVEAGRRPFRRGDSAPR